VEGEPRKLDKLLALVLAALLAADAAVGVAGLMGLQRTAEAYRAQLSVLEPSSDAARQVQAKLGDNRWDFGLQAAGAAVAAAGAALALAVALRYPRAGWLLAAAGVPALVAVLDSAPGATALSANLVSVVQHLVTRSSGATEMAPLEPLSVLRFALAALAAVVYMVIAARLRPRMSYGMTCGGLAAAALFFSVWSPPPPTPVPTRLDPVTGQPKRLSLMADQVLAALNAKIEPGQPRWSGGHEPLSKKDETLVGADDYLNLIIRSPDKQYAVGVYITYNADAMTNIPHVPWICMMQSGAFDLVSWRTDDLPIKGISAPELTANVLLFRPAPGRVGPSVFMFQYFSAGGTYQHDREMARLIAAAGSHSQRGSFISQTQVQVQFMASAAGDDPTDRHSPTYGLGYAVMSIVVPLLEKEYYPDLRAVGAQ